MPYFSIIIPIYNKEKYAEECVDSVLAQDFRDFEAILVDDGSSDRSPEICDRYAASDSRIVVIHKENGGLSDARNAGLDAASGEYILFLDGDDFWCDDRMLSKLSAKLSGARTDILIFGAKKLYTSTEIEDAWISGFREEDFQKSDPPVRYLMQRNILQASAWSKAVRAALIEENGMRFVKDQLSEDIEWTIRLLAAAESYDVIPEAFCMYRQNEDSISHHIGRKNCEDVCRVISRYASEQSPDQEKQAPLRHYLANQYLLWMTFSNLVDKREINSLLEEMKGFYWLLEYDWYPYVKKAGKLRSLGFHGMRAALRLYKKTKGAGKAY